MRIDLNCDLGEGEPIGRTRELMEWITSANIACGGHAGDEESMRQCVRLAREFDVNLGAHPGPWSRTDNGRGVFTITADHLKSLLLEQVGALRQIAATEDSEVHHVKLHGSLYHSVERDPELAETYVELVRNQWPGIHIVAFAGGRVARVAKQKAIPVWEEAFADRAYQKSGQLVPRRHPGAVLSDVDEIAKRVKRLIQGDGLSSHCGSDLNIRCETLCVHSDSPNALEVVRKLSQILKENGHNL